VLSRPYSLELRDSLAFSDQFPRARQTATQPHHGARSEFFRHRAETHRQRLRELFRLGRSSLVIGLVALAGAIALGDVLATLMKGSGIGEIVREGLQADVMLNGPGAAPPAGSGLIGGSYRQGSIIFSVSIKSAEQAKLLALVAEIKRNLK
jgi:hypothetical protein